MPNDYHSQTQLERTRRLRELLRELPERFAQTGVTVHAYVRQKRLVNAARLIREGTPAAKAAADSGFTDYSAFHRAFRESFGMSPGKLKK